VRRAVTTYAENGTRFVQAEWDAKIGYVVTLKGLDNIEHQGVLLSARVVANGMALCAEIMYEDIDHINPPMIDITDRIRHTPNPNIRLLKGKRFTGQRGGN